MEKLFNIVKRGYDQEEVDNYIHTLETLIKSYKDKDDTIKNAIINAQIAADNIIKNAEIEGDRIKKRAIRLLSEIQASVETQKRITRDFQEEYNRLTTKYLQNIGNTEIEKVLGKITELEEYVANMQKTHDGNLIGTANTDVAIPKMVAGTAAPVGQVPLDAHNSSNANDDDGDDDTVALVAELLAKDKPKS
ncbi:MAG: DivIVA domain-containing protein [Defluviitaleaceae bacterium]|nr:DivIVA domain-containing protein [Defluviitaleaceae bacterium]